MRRVSRPLLAGLFWFLSLLCMPLAALGAEIEISNAQLQAVDDGIAVSADFGVDFNSRLEEAVNKGVVLYFVVDFEIARARWYWFDEKLLTRTQTWRLSYHALTRQYRLSTGALHQSFDNLQSALRMLSRLRNWVVLEKPEKGDRLVVRAGDNYQAALRIRLDISQLPKPFQIAALASREWNLVSDWRIWPVAMPADAK